MTDYPHVPAAFINAISEEGTKAEAVAFLQRQWNENCALRAELKAARALPLAPRMVRGRALYLAVYESQGANWEANDCKELWCDKADRYLELASSVSRPTHSSEAK